MRRCLSIAAYYYTSSSVYVTPSRLRLVSLPYRLYRWWNKKVSHVNFYIDWFQPIVLLHAVWPAIGMILSFKHNVVGCIVQPQHTAKNWTAKMSASGIVMGSAVTWPWLFQTRHFQRFGSAAIPYVVRSTIGLRSDKQQLCVFVKILSLS